MFREVILDSGEHTKTYQVDTDTHYAARAEALKQFLEEFKYPGRPVDYIGGRRKGLINISVKTAIDRRTLERPNTDDGQYFLEQIERLRKYVRTSEILKDRNRAKATELLLKLEEVLSG